MRIIPICLCRNEEIWISRIILPFMAVFGNVIVADTGSTDSTVDEIEKIPGVTLLKLGNLSPADLGQGRKQLQKEAKERFGAERVFMFDGDELYPTKYLKFIYDNPMPDDAPGGFTYGVECTELGNGECWQYDVGCNRHAIFSVDSQWHGAYPFESPDSYIPGDPKNHYWVSPGPGYNFYHLHHMRRSRKDEDVYLRMQKKNQFSMADHPEIKPARFWLNSESDYNDE